MQGQGIGWGHIQQRTPCGNLIIEVDPPPMGGSDGSELPDELEQLSLAEIPRISVDEVGIQVLAHMAIRAWSGVLEYLGDIAVNPGPNKEMALKAMKCLAQKNIPKAIFFMGAYFAMHGQNFPAYLWYLKAAQFFPEAARRAEDLHAIMYPPQRPLPPLPAIPQSPPPEDRR